MADRGRPVLSALASGALFGTAGTAAALGPAGATPLGVGWVRISGGAAVLLVAHVLSGGRLRDLTAVCRQPLLWVAAASAGGYQVCFFAGTKAASVALATLVTVGSAPVFAGVLAWVFLRHRPTRGWVVATALCLVGLTGVSSSGIRSTELGPSAAVGIALALGAGVSIAGYTVAATRLLQDGVPQLTLTTAAYLVGGTLLVPVAATQPWGWLASPSGAAVAVYLGVATMAVANLLYLRGLAHLSPGPTATLVLVDPVMAAILGVVVLDEHLTPLALAGFALVLVGLLVQTYAAHADSPPVG